MAPEIFEGKPYGRSVDWWSMGIIVFEMIHGLAPFDVADRGNTKVWDHFHMLRSGCRCFMVPNISITYVTYHYI